jgi:hypothetical protein
MTVYRVVTYNMENGEVTYKSFLYYLRFKDAEKYLKIARQDDKKLGETLQVKRYSVITTEVI